MKTLIAAIALSIGTTGAMADNRSDMIGAFILGTIIQRNADIERDRYAPRVLPPPVYRYQDRYIGPRDYPHVDKDPVYPAYREYPACRGNQYCIRECAPRMMVDRYGRFIGYVYPCEQ